MISGGEKKSRAIAYQVSNMVAAPCSTLTAALSPAQMRSELASQYAILRDMGEALDAAEERVRTLERWKDLAQLADRDDQVDEMRVQQLHE